MTLDEADQVMHLPETGCWAHKGLTDAGFVCRDEPQRGFVRQYTYNHEDGSKIVVNTGVNADYWSGSDAFDNVVPQSIRGAGHGFSVYWRGLKEYFDTRDPN